MALADLDDSPFGVNSHEQSEYITRLAGQGVRWFRVDFKWSAIARSRSQEDWHWEAADSMAEAAAAAGASLLVVAAYTPRWASREEDQANKSEDQKDALPPTDPSSYLEFVEAVVRRFAVRIHALSLWNEPNLGKQFWLGSREQYMATIIPALERVREIAPDLVLAGPDLSTWSDKGSKEWLEDLSRRTVPQRVYDVITHHQYGADDRDSVKSRVGRIDELRRFLERNGLSEKPVWVTETGWNQPKFTKERQVESMREIMQAMKQRSAWWKKTFWYDSHGFATYGREPVDFGLIGGPDSTEPGLARPALGAYAEIIRAEGIVPPIGIEQARETVKILYRVLLRRAPGEIEGDREGVESNARAFQRTSLGIVVDGIMKSAEFNGRWNSLPPAEVARTILENLPGAQRDDTAVGRLAAEIASGVAGRRIAAVIDPMRTA